MFSLPKLLVLGLIIAAVWYGFKALSRGGGETPRAGKAAGSKKLGAEDLVKCSVCGVYVSPENAPRCDRPDCPYGPEVAP